MLELCPLRELSSLGELSSDVEGRRELARTMLGCWAELARTPEALPSNLWDGGLGAWPDTGILETHTGERIKEDSPETRALIMVL